MDACKRRKELQVAQQKFGFAIVALVVCLGGVGASMKLKVELAVPSREFGSVLGFLFEPGEEVVHRITHLDARK